MDHRPMLFHSPVPLFRSSPHNFHTLCPPFFTSQGRSRKYLRHPPFSFLLHVQSKFTLTIHIGEKTTLIPNLI